ncbi:MAG: DUF6476 family protein [Pseudomonadota bacterium]
MDPDALFPEDPRFALMRRLVTYLLVVLIVGVSTIVIALLVKLQELNFAAPPPRAAQIAMPGLQAGERLLEARATPERITLVLENGDGVRRAIILDGRTFEPLLAAQDQGPNSGGAGSP